MFQENSFLVLYTDNVTQTRDFYNTLGATENKYEEQDKYVCTLGGINLHFIQAETEPQTTYRTLTTSDHRGHGIIVYLKISDTTIEDAIEKIISIGGCAKTEIFENHWGGREILITDPNGYNFALYQK